MAIKPTIIKFHANLSDLNRNYYDNLSLTIALHPSETHARMMARVLAFCINAHPDLSFSKGISDVDEPDIWQHTLDKQIALWIEVGEPSIERIKKACRLAQAVKIYCFNTKSDVWWQQIQSKLGNLKVQVYRFDWEYLSRLSALVSKGMNASVTINDNSAYIALENGECEIFWSALSDG